MRSFTENSKIRDYSRIMSPLIKKTITIFEVLTNVTVMVPVVGM